jgi:hypothetical protein
MNYEIWTDEPNTVLLDEFTLFPETRPHVGDIIAVKNQTEDWRITRSEPTNNPDDQKVIYYAIPFVDPVTPQEQIKNAFL